jgi:chemotaxis protein methyltransferase CheR
VRSPRGWLALSPLDCDWKPDGFEAIDEPGCRLLRRAAPESAPASPAVAPADPKPPSVLTLARTEADRGRLTLCRAALQEDPLDAEAHLLLAAVEEERGDLDAAIASLGRAIYVTPDASTAHFRLGGLLLRIGAEEDGRRSLATAAALLRERPPDALVPGGLTAGRLLAALEPAP